MPRRVKRTIEVLGNDGSVQAIPNPSRWTLPNRPYGYVFNRNGVAVARYRDRQRSTGLFFLPKNRTAAVRFAETWIQSLDATPTAAPSPAPAAAALTITDVWSQYELAKLTGATVKDVRRRKIANRSLEWFVEVNEPLTNESIERLSLEGLGRMSGRLAPKTVHSYFSPWSQFVSWCRARGWINVDVAGLVRLPEIPKKGVARAYSEEELDRIDTWFAKRRPLWLRELWRFLAWTGMRIHEALALTWAQVYADRIELEVTKGDRPRSIPLRPFPELVACLDRLRAISTDDRLFPKTQNATAVLLKACLDELKIPYPTQYQHVFRATAVRRWKAMRIPLEVRARMSGHSPAMAIAVYDPEDQAEALALAIEAATAPPTTPNPPARYSEAARNAPDIEGRDESG